MKYYFLSCVLPVLNLEKEPIISFNDFINMVLLNVTNADKNKVVQLRKLIDLKNLKNYWMDRNIDERGNLNKKDIENILLVKNEVFSENVFEFIRINTNVEDKINNFHKILFQFLFDESKKKGFYGKYMRLELEINLILAAIRAKKLKKDLLTDLQFEDLDVHDFFIHYVLMQKDAEIFNPPSEYQELSNLFDKYYPGDPLLLNLSILKFKIKKISELRKPVFSIGVVLAYMIKLIIIEDYHRLNKEYGEKFIFSFSTVKEGK